MPLKETPSMPAGASSQRLHLPCNASKRHNKARKKAGVVSSRQAHLSVNGSLKANETAPARSSGGVAEEKQLEARVSLSTQSQNTSSLTVWTQFGIWRASWTISVACVVVIFIGFF